MPMLVRGPWLAPLVLMLLSGCAGGTCPKGSSSVDGKCVPLQGCPAGQERRGGECVPLDGNAGETRDGGEDAGDRESGPAGGSKDGGDAAAPDEPDPQDEPVDPCADLECGEHGSCQADGAAAFCACEDDWAGDRCDACAAGLGLSDDGECVPLCEARDAPDCGEHGTCVADDQLARCACDHPRGGPTCEGCAEGYALEDGECVADCGDCGAHAFCSAETLVPSCACVAGYADHGEGCVWDDGTTGGIVDGEFDDPSAWVGTRHVVFENGSARFTSAGTGKDCELGVLSQMLTMPAREVAEPFVLEIRTSASCVGAGCAVLQVELGNSATRVQVPESASAAARSMAVCLGEAAYGGQVPLRIRPALIGSDAAWSCASSEWPALDGLAIRPARPGECPPASGVRNGDFASGDGWSLAEGASIDNGALVLTGSTQPTTALIPFPLPFSKPSAALRFTHSANLVVYLDGLLWTAFATGPHGTRSLCLPAFSLGAVHRVGFQGTGTLRDVEIVTDTRCADGAFDRSFERPLATGSWFPFTPAEVLASDRAFGGANALRVSGNATVIGLGRFPVPPSASGAHAAFILWHRAALPDTTSQVSLHQFATLNQSIAAYDQQFSQTDWAIAVQCPGRAWDGQLSFFSVVVSATRQTSGGTIGAEVWLDETGPTLSDACP